MSRLHRILVVLVMGGAAGTVGRAQPAPPAAENEPPPITRPPASLLPTNRQPVIVSPEEPNPFAKRAGTRQRLQLEQAETEEIRIKNLIAEMPIGGISGEGEEFRILIGSLMVEVGDEVPALVPAQSERLIVTHLTPQVIGFAFLEQDGKPGNRTFLRGYSLKPRVRYLLPSEAPTSAERPTGPELNGLIIPPPHEEP